VTTLGTRLRKGGAKLKNEQLRAILERLVSQGRAHRHPSRRTRNASPVYWRRSAEEYVEEAVRGALARKAEWTESQLRGIVTRAYLGLVDECVGRMLSRGELFEAPARGRTRRLRISPPRPREALTPAQGRSLRTILTRVNTLRRPALPYEDLMRFLDGTLEEEADTASRGRRRSRQPIAPTESLLLRLYGEDLPRREGLRSMPIPWTWRRYAAHCDEAGGVPDAEGFHRLLLELAQAGRIAVGVHDKPSNVPPDELAVLRRDAEGRLPYYWTPLGGRS
jgi:hypothetical protein